MPTSTELNMSLPGDELIEQPTAVIDSAFDLPAPPAIVFPWFLQLGKQRAGWYFPRKIERFIPRSKRGLRHIESKWQNITVGQRIPDYGGSKGYFDCFYLNQNEAIGYTSTRGKLTMTWVITLHKVDSGTRVVIRLRLKSTSRSSSPLWIVGKLFDRITILGLAAGLHERVNH